LVRPEVTVVIAVVVARRSAAVPVVVPEGGVRGCAWDLWVCVGEWECAWGQGSGSVDGARGAASGRHGPRVVGRAVPVVPVVVTRRGVTVVVVVVVVTVVVV
jgi:hypothetical protein